jgi:hypothetical protein
VRRKGDVSTLKKLCFNFDEELLKALKGLGDLTVTEALTEGALLLLDYRHARPPDFPTLDERRAANRERLRQTALKRWRKP